MVFVFFVVFALAAAGDEGQCPVDGPDGRFCRNNLHPDRMNKNIRDMEYAVRGRIVIRAGELEAELSKDPTKFSFKEIIYCNIGNPQALKQPPLTFPNMVMALLNFPKMIEWEQLPFPEDVKRRATNLLQNMPGGIGAYSHSQGIPYVRQSVANFIAKRDGFPSSPNDIFLTNGASPAIKFILRMLTSSTKDTFLLPNPQYPLYTASVGEAGGSVLPYTLDERNGWSMDVTELEAIVAEGRSRGLSIRALVVINPGNPTGQVLTPENAKQVVLFCAKHKIILLADEVYQSNVYDAAKHFVSFKKVLRQVEQEGALAAFDPVELFSFHSVSKGLHGECGRRGGYLEAVNTHPAVLDTLYKMASVSLCANTAGQLMVELMVNPPRPGDESYSIYQQEVEAIYQSLKRRSASLVNFFNSIHGISVQQAAGAMYVFPQVTVPAAAVAEAKQLAMPPDVHFALLLLENTGICVVPGSGFIIGNTSVLSNQQVQDPPGTSFYFRTTFLPPENKMGEVTDRFQRFYEQYLATYSQGSQKQRSMWQGVIQ